MATGQVNGRWQTLTPHRIATPEPMTTKFGKTDYVRERTPLTKFGTNPSTGGIWANGRIITFLCLFISTFFLRLTCRSDRLMDFHARQLKRREITCLFGVTKLKFNIKPLFEFFSPENA